MITFIKNKFLTWKVKRRIKSLSDESISLLSRSMLAKELIKPSFKTSIRLAECITLYFKPCTQNMPYLIAELLRVGKELELTDVISNSNIISEEHEIRLDKWIVIDNGYNPNALYEGYLACGEAIKKINDIVENNLLITSYVERKCSKYLQTFLILTEVLFEIHLNNN